MGYWATVMQELARRHVAFDAKMIRDYLKREGLARIDVRHVFSPGDLVLQKQKQPNKQKCKATGPYVFVEYVG